MAMLLYNPTNEVLSGRHGGIDYSVPAKRGKLRVEDGCGNHLLNHLGPRGLTFIDVEDDEEKIKEKEEASIEANISFKRKMINEYNVRNEQRKHIGLEFLEPTKEVKAYAEELNLNLIEPYLMEKSDDVSKLTTLIAELLNRVSELEKGKKK